MTNRKSQDRVAITVSPLFGAGAVCAAGGAFFVSSAPIYLGYDVFSGRDNHTMMEPLGMLWRLSI
jgi:hypothetical protein